MSDKKHVCVYCGEEVSPEEAMFDLDDGQFDCCHIWCHSKHNKPLISNSKELQKLLDFLPVAFMDMP